MDVIRFFCAKCGKKIKVAPQFAGVQGNCPACSHEFTVPPAADQSTMQAEYTGDVIPEEGLTDATLGELASAVAQKSSAHDSPGSTPAKITPPHAKAAEPPCAQQQALPSDAESVRFAETGKEEDQPASGTSPFGVQTPPDISVDRPHAPNEIVPGSAPTGAMFSCPVCGDTHTQRLSVIYASGTATQRTRSRNNTLIFTGGWTDFIPVLGSSSATSVQQTELAMRLSPPPKPGLFSGKEKKLRYVMECELWSRKWFCHRCGSVFDVNGPRARDMTFSAVPEVTLLLSAAKSSSATDGSGVLLKVVGWIVTVIFGLIWLGVSTPDNMPVFGLTVSLVIFPIALVYLLAPSFRKSVDGVLANIRPGLKLPSVRLLVIFGISLLMTVPEVTDRLKANMEVYHLVTAAKEAHANGNLVQAVELLNKATLEFHADDRDDAQAMLSDYEKELGLAQEPEVARLISFAKEVAASGDNAKAISLLTQATDHSFQNAPNWTEAYELLKELKPP